MTHNQEPPNKLSAMRSNSIPSYTSILYILFFFSTIFNPFVFILPFIFISWWVTNTKTEEKDEKEKTKKRFSNAIAKNLQKTKHVSLLIRAPRLPDGEVRYTQSRYLSHGSFGTTWNIHEERTALDTFPYGRSRFLPTTKMCG